MNMQNLSEAVSSNTTAGRSLYQKIQVAGLVAPFVDALTRSPNLDAIWAVPFTFEEMAHPSRPTLKLSAAIKRAEHAAANEHMRVDSLESARSALMKASQYSEWTQRSHAPLIELLNIAISNRQSQRSPSDLSKQSDQGD